MHLRSSVPAPHGPALQAQLEIGHIHSQDFSMHFMLSPRDCQLGEYRLQLGGVRIHWYVPDQLLNRAGERDTLLVE